MAVGVALGVASDRFESVRFFSLRVRCRSVFPGDGDGVLVPATISTDGELDGVPTGFLLVD